MKYCIWLTKEKYGEPADEVWHIEQYDINYAHSLLDADYRINKSLGYKREFEIREIE